MVLLAVPITSGMQMPRGVRAVYKLTKDTVMAFLDNGGPLLSAALAFYSILSIAPLALIAVYLAGLFFGEEAANAQVRHGLQGFVGEASAATLAGLVEKLRHLEGGRSASIVGGVLTVFAASRLFSQLQDAINQLWHVRTDFTSLKAGIAITVYKKLLAVVLVLLLGVLLGSVIALSTMAAAAKGMLGSALPGSETMWALWPIGTTATLVALAFALIYRLMPDATVAWRDAGLGAGVAGMLFALAEWPLSFYLAHQGVESAYGAAGSLVVLLLWTYYAAHIFFFGAQLAQVYGASRGRQPNPDAMAVLVKQVVVEPR